MTKAIAVLTALWLAGAAWADPIPRRPPKKCTDAQKARTECVQCKDAECEGYGEKGYAELCSVSGTWEGPMVWCKKPKTKN
jgi:hypothetical protein